MKKRHNILSHLRSESAEGQLVATAGIAAAVLLAILLVRQYGPSVGALSGSSLYRSISCAAGNCSAPVSAGVNAGPNGTETAVDIDGDGTPDVIAVDLDGDGRIDVFTPLNGTQDTALSIQEEDILDEFDNIIGRNTLINGVPIGDLAFTPDGIADILRLNGIDPNTATLAQIAALADRFEGAEIEQEENGLVTGIGLDIDGDGVVDRTVSAENLAELLAINGITLDALTLTAASELAALTTAVQPIIGEDGKTIAYALDLNGDGVYDTTVSPTNLVDFLTANGLDPDTVASDFDALTALADIYNIPGLTLETDADGTITQALIDVDGDGVADASTGNPDLFATTGTGVQWKPDEVYDFMDYIRDNGWTSALDKAFAPGYKGGWHDSMQFIDADEDGIVDFVAIDLNGDGEAEFVNPTKGNGFEFLDGGMVRIDLDGDGRIDRTFRNVLDPKAWANAISGTHNFTDARELYGRYRWSYDYGLDFGDGEGRDVFLYTPEGQLLTDAYLDQRTQQAINGNAGLQQEFLRLQRIRATSGNVDAYLAGLTPDQIAAIAARAPEDRRGYTEYYGSEGQQRRFVSYDPLTVARQQLLVERAMANLSPAEFNQLSAGLNLRDFRYNHEGKRRYFDLDPADVLRDRLFDLAAYFGSPNDDIRQQYETLVRANNPWGSLDPVKALAAANKNCRPGEGCQRERYNGPELDNYLNDINSLGGLDTIEKLIADDLERGPTDKKSRGAWGFISTVIGVALDLTTGFGGTLWRLADNVIIQGKSFGESLLGAGLEFATKGLSKVTGGIQNSLLRNVATSVGKEALSVVTDGKFDIGNVALGVASAELGRGIEDLGIDGTIANSIANNGLRTIFEGQDLGDSLVNVGFAAAGTLVGDALTQDRRNDIALAESLSGPTEETRALRNEISQIEGAIDGAFSGGASLVNGGSIDAAGGQIVGSLLGAGILSERYDGPEILEASPAQPALPISSSPLLVGDRELLLAAFERADGTGPRQGQWGNEINIYVADSFSESVEGCCEGSLSESLNDSNILLPRNVDPSIVQRLNDPSQISDRELSAIRSYLNSPALPVKMIAEDIAAGREPDLDFVLDVHSTSLEDGSVAYETLQDILVSYHDNSAVYETPEAETAFFVYQTTEQARENAREVGRLRHQAALNDIEYQRYQSEAESARVQAESLQASIDGRNELDNSTYYAYLEDIDAGQRSREAALQEARIAAIEQDTAETWRQIAQLQERGEQALATQRWLYQTGVSPDEGKEAFDDILSGERNPEEVIAVREGQLILAQAAQVAEAVPNIGDGLNIPEPTLLNYAIEQFNQGARLYNSALDALENSNCLTSAPCNPGLFQPSDFKLTEDIPYDSPVELGVAVATEVVGPASPLFGPRVGRALDAVDITGNIVGGVDAASEGNVLEAAQRGLGASAGSVGLANDLTSPRRLGNSDAPNDSNAPRTNSTASTNTEIDGQTTDQLNTSQNQSDSSVVNPSRIPPDNSGTNTDGPGGAIVLRGGPGDVNVDGGLVLANPSTPTTQVPDPSSTAIVPTSPRDGPAESNNGGGDSEIIDIDLPPTRPDPLALPGRPEPLALGFGSSEALEISTGPLKLKVGTDPATGRSFAEFSCSLTCQFNIANGGLSTNFTGDAWLPNVSRTQQSEQPILGLDYGVSGRLEGLGFEFSNSWSRNNGSSSSVKTPLDDVDIETEQPPGDPTGETGPPAGIGRFVNANLEGTGFASYTITAPPWMSPAGFQRWLTEYRKILGKSPHRIPESTTDPVDIPRVPENVPEETDPSESSRGNDTADNSMMSVSAETLITTLTCPLLIEHDTIVAGLFTPNNAQHATQGYAWINL